MRALKYLIIISLFILACKKPYEDPPIKTGISNLVVECTITNEPPPYIVKLTKSVGYNSNSSLTKVSYAKISILDDAGNVENLIERYAGSGIYQTSATGIQGQIGRSYKLRILLTDGKLNNPRITSTYESDWVKLNEPPTIDSIYAETGQMQTLLQESDGTYYVNTKLGLNMYIGAQPPANQDYYYKFKSSMIQQYIQTYYPDTILGRYTTQSILPITLYSWNTFDITLDKDLKAGSAQYSVPIENFFTGFIPEYSSTYTDTFHEAKLSAGAITTTTIYSVSKKVYRIFTEENSQTNPSNSIFDPIPTQLESNIKCINDSTISVLGYFNAASVVHNYHFFLWNVGSTKIYSYKIDSLPPGIEPSGTDTGVTPNFWAYPYPPYNK